MKIAIVVPTIRPESFRNFMIAWSPLFIKHDCELIIVWDGEKPKVEHRTKLESKFTASIQQIMGKDASCLTNFNAGIRNLGFAYIAKFLPDIEAIITLDDDETPIGDPIQDHIDALSRRVPITWLSTAVDDYTRGFPYAIRDEAEVVLSHGIWHGVADWDAPTQLVRGSHYPVEFYKGPIPKGIFYPMCSMNLAFKRKMLPFIFHAPWAGDVRRFDDIFAGVESKREIDKRGWAAVTGYAAVKHERASNVFKNLSDEAKGILLNETFYKGDESHPYFINYREKYKTWLEFISKCENP